MLTNISVLFLLFLAAFLLGLFVGLSFSAKVFEEDSNIANIEVQ